MATITEDYVSFETAKLLKEKGFNERLLTFYITDEAKKEGCFQLMAFTDDKIDNNHSDHCYLAPTLQMAMKWLRKEHYCHVIIDYTFTADANLSDEYVSYCYKVENARTYIQYTHNEWYNTYEKAVEAAIKYCLEHLI